MELCDTGDVLIDLLSDIKNWDCARNSLEKYTHQQDETQGNNNTQALSTIRRLHLTWRRWIVSSACVLLFPIFLFYWWVHFPRSVPFCQPRQQLFAHSWDCACSSFSPASIQALKLKGNGSEGTWRGHSNRNRIKNICPAVFHRISYPSCSKLMFESHENVTGSAAILCPTVYSWHKQSRKCGRSTVSYTHLTLPTNHRV